jgi:signal transduction histidine kinase
VSRPLEREALSVLVHEVRSSVAALSAIAETVGDPVREAPDRAELARLAITACRAIERIVLDVVTTSVWLEILDPAALVRDAAAAASLSGTTVEVRVGSALPTVRGDPVRLRQALDNLVANALAHSGTSRLVMGASASAREVRLYVADSGAGIPPADQERIFRAGVRLDPGRSGSGLGLAVVSAIAEAHGGTVSVVSAPGAGSTFTIALPAS